MFASSPLDMLEADVDMVPPPSTPPVGVDGDQQDDDEDQHMPLATNRVVLRRTTF